MVRTDAASGTAMRRISQPAASRVRACATQAPASADGVLSIL